MSIGHVALQVDKTLWRCIHSVDIFDFFFFLFSASFGGFLGLAVGASLITVLEILELLITSLFNCINRK